MPRTGYRMRHASVLVRSKTSRNIAIALVVGGVAAAQIGTLSAQLLIASVCAFAYWARFGSARSRKANVRADDEGLWIDDALVLRRAEIRAGRVIERKDHPPLVDISARGMKLSVRVVAADMPSSRALLGALGIDRRTGTRKFVLPGWRLSSLPSMLALFVGVFFVVTTIVARLHIAPSIAFAAALVASVVTLVAAKLVTRVTMTIAQDGLLLESFRRSTFVRFGDIERVERLLPRGRTMISPGFGVALASGRTLRFYTLDERVRGEGMYLGDHVMAALQKVMKSVRRADATATLIRGGRPPREWLMSLRSLAEGRSYRAAPISAGELFDVLADASATDELRAASAAALATLNEPKIKRRLRIASEDIAAPRVRIALEAALAADDDALVNALEAASIVE